MSQCSILPWGGNFDGAGEMRLIPEKMMEGETYFLRTGLKEINHDIIF